MRVVAGVACIALLLLLAAGCGESNGLPHTARTSVPEVKISGARPAERRVLLGIVQELSPTDITRVRIARDRNGWLGVLIDAPETNRATREAETLASLYVDAASSL